MEVYLAEEEVSKFDLEVYCSYLQSSLYFILAHLCARSRGDVDIRLATFAGTTSVHADEVRVNLLVKSLRNQASGAVRDEDGEHTKESKRKNEKAADFIY